mgnify:CR=1 FL=1
MDTTPWDPEGAAALLDAEGRLTGGATLGGLDARAYYKQLVAARGLDVRLSRAGLPMWASSAGEEAPLVATGRVAHAEEWIYPGVRDVAIAMVRDWGWMLVAEFSWQRISAPGSWPNRFKNGFEPVYHYTKNKKIKFS